MKPAILFKALLTSAALFNVVTLAEGLPPNPTSCAADLVRDSTESLPIHLALKKFHELLGARPELKNIYIQTGIFPLSFLQHLNELIEKQDPAFEAILQGLASTWANSRDAGNLWLFMNGFVYDLLAMKPFKEEESDENILIFLEGFKRAIGEQGSRMQKEGMGDAPFSIRREKELQAFMEKEFLHWFAEKRVRFQSIFSSVKAQPDQLKKLTPDLYWAYSVSRVVKKNLGPQALLQLGREDQVQIDTVSAWLTVPVRYKTIQEPVPKPSALQFLFLMIRFARPQVQPASRQVATPNVENLDPNDPIWLFNDAIPAAPKTFAGDDIEDGKYETFNRFASFNILPGDFSNVPKWWARTENISGLTSRGMPREFRGHEFTRKITWPTNKWAQGGVHSIHLDRMRVAETKTPDGRISTLEVLASRNGIHWHPFFFKRVGDFWVRESHIDGITVEAKCMQCHTSDGRGKVPLGALSPRPLGFTNIQQFVDVGYKTTNAVRDHEGELIRRFLEY